MKGTWQGGGTWQTTGGSPGTAMLAVVVVVALVGVAEWIISHIWELVGGLAVLAAVVIAALRWLLRVQERRQVRWTAQRHAQIAGRAQSAMPTMTAVPLTAAERRELPPSEVHLHFHGLPDAEQAAIIRQAIERN